MLGAGPLEAALRARRESLGLVDKVSIAGFELDMPGALADLDIVVSTSLREGMQVAVLEAMAAGVLPIATAVGGAAELIADTRSGFLVPPSDPKGVAKQILHALDQPPSDLVTQRTVARLRARERFGLERGLARHAALYRELLEEGPP
jgi:glycosyltransferase involved in cell wall biosynthesis